MNNIALFVEKLSINSKNDLYCAAIQYFSDEMCMNIEDDYIKNHSEELIYCFSHDMSIVVFDSWTCYEDLIGERISYDEYSFLNDSFKRDVLEVTDEEWQEILFLKRLLEEYRLSE